MRATALLVLIISLPISIFAQNSITTGNFNVDPATPHCLGFRWFMNGDDNENAVCSVAYRPTGDPMWKTGMPMLRICNDTVLGYWPVSNLFAGSVLFLDPGISYDVRFSVSDPDGGQKDTTVTTSTATYPAVFSGGNTVHVYPPGYSGTKETPNASSIKAAVEAATAGTIVLVHGGAYNESDISPSNDGTQNSPIVIRGAGDGEAVIECGGAETCFEVRYLEYYHFENITIQNAVKGINLGGSTGFVVRDCKFLDMGKNGICCYSSEPGYNCFFMNNYITGPYQNWYPRTSMSGDPTGIVTYGTQMVTCYNTIINFWDSYEVTGNRTPGLDENVNPRCICVDIYNNDFLNNSDDGFEFDYALNNIRAWHNRVMNAESGITTQPFYGGPGYIIRNVVFNCTYTCLKIHNRPSGLEIYNNTLGAFFGSAVNFTNVHIRNNAFLRSSGSYVMETGSTDDRVRLDYNGYINKPSSYGFYFKWYIGSAFWRISSLAEFFSQCLQEEHGVLVEYTDWENMYEAVEGSTYVPDDVDFRIAGQGPVDKGWIIPQVTDGYASTAPDIGAIEYGDSLPHYGILPGGVNSVFNPAGQKTNLAFSGEAAGRSMVWSSFMAHLMGIDASNSSLRIYSVDGRLIGSIDDSHGERLRSKFDVFKNKLSNGHYIIQCENGRQSSRNLVLLVK